MKQLLLTGMLALCTMPATFTQNNLATQTVLNAFANPLISEQDLINLLTVPDVDVNALNNEGQTLLMLATQYGYEDLATALLANKLNPNAQDNHQRTALMFAAQQGTLTTVSTLLHSGATAHTQDCYGNSATDYAQNQSLNAAVLKKYKPAQGDSAQQAAAKYIQLLLLQTTKQQNQATIIHMLANHQH